MNNISGDTSDLTGKGVIGSRKRVGVNEYVYIKVPAATPAGTPLVVSYEADESGVIVKGVAPSTLDVYQEVAITPKLAGSVDEFMWCQTCGITKALVNGTDNIAKNDFLELPNAGTALISDSTVRSVNSVAIACEDYNLTTDALKTVQLLGDRVIIAAS